MGGSAFLTSVNASDLDSFSFLDKKFPIEVETPNYDRNNDQSAT